MFYWHLNYVIVIIPAAAIAAAAAVMNAINT